MSKLKIAIQKAEARGLDKFSPLYRNQFGAIGAEL